MRSAEAEDRKFTGRKEKSSERKTEQKKRTEKQIEERKRQKEKGLSVCRRKKKKPKTHNNAADINTGHIPDVPAFICGGRRDFHLSGVKQLSGAA